MAGPQHRARVRRDASQEGLLDTTITGDFNPWIEIAELLIGYPVIDVPRVRVLIGKTFEAANQAVAKLVAEGILTEITGRRQNRCSRAWTYGTRHVGSDRRGYVPPVGAAYLRGVPILWITTAPN